MAFGFVAISPGENNIAQQNRQPSPPADALLAPKTLVVIPGCRGRNKIAVPLRLLPLFEKFVAQRDYLEAAFYKPLLDCLVDGWISTREL